MVVFLKYVKEYPWKISGSSWDIAEQKTHLVTGERCGPLILAVLSSLNQVTGFSGTNDAQYLLPMSIHQDDPNHLHQTGTNARVLVNLLHPDNNHYMVTAYENGERWISLKLLKIIITQEPEFVFYWMLVHKYLISQITPWPKHGWT